MDKPVYKYSIHWDETVYTVSRKKNVYTYRWLGFCSIEEREIVVEDDILPAILDSQNVVKLTASQFDNELFDRISNDNQYKLDVRVCKSQSDSPTILFHILKCARFQNDYYLYAERLIDMPRIIDWKYDVNWHYHDLDKSATMEIMLLGNDGFPTGEWIAFDIRTPIYAIPHQCHLPLFSHSNYDVYWTDLSLDSNNAGIMLRPQYNEITTRVQWDLRTGNSTEFYNYTLVLDSVREYILKIQKTGWKG